MTAKARLKQIADGIDSQSDEDSAYFDRETGEVLVVSREEMGAAEEGEPLDDVPEWQQELIETARKILNDNDGRYLPIPGKWDFHEYEVMERFCLSLDDEEQSDDLFDAIRGRGAFRRFKDGIHRLGIQDDWYRFRDGALLELAAGWAEENGIELVAE